MARALIVLALLAGIAHATPVLEVRGRARLTLERVRRSVDGVQVIGRLGDGEGGGIAGLDVTVRVEGQSIVATTATGGRFVAEFTLSDGKYPLEMVFEGASHLDPASLGPVDIEVGKATLGLIVRPPLGVPTSAAAVEVLVEAATDAGPAAATVTLGAGDAASAKPRVETTITLDENGRGTASLPTEQLGEAGPKWVRARVPGSGAWNPTEVEATFLFVVEARFEGVEMPPTRVPHEQRVVVTGRLEGGAGEAIARAPVALVAAGRTVATAPTDERGTFRVEVPAAELAPGPVSLGVEFNSPVPWRVSAKGPTMLLEIRPPAPLPIAYTIGGLAAALAALAWLVLARTRPWAPLIAAWRRRRAPAKVASGPASADAPMGGLKRARPSIVSTLRRPASLKFSGKVWDAARGRPVAGARVRVGADGTLADVATDAGGAFAITTLPIGEHAVEVVSPGFVPERFAITIPHRGELEDVRVDLVPVRERVYEIFRGAARPVVPSPEVLAVWTPGEVARHARRMEPLAALTEDACYAPEAPALGVVDEAKRLAELTHGGKGN